MIIVFDSSILVSALHRGGTPLEAVSAAMDAGTLSWCEEIRHEVVKTLLGKKFRWEEAKLNSAVSIFFQPLHRVTLLGNISGICRDPKDDMVLECAMRAGAHFIISGDRDLLDLGVYEGISIITSRMFLDLMTAQSGLCGPN